MSLKFELYERLRLQSDSKLFQWTRNWSCWLWDGDDQGDQIIHFHLYHGLNAFDGLSSSILATHLFRLIIALAMSSETPQSSQWWWWFNRIRRNQTNSNSISSKQTEPPSRELRITSCKFSIHFHVEWAKRARSERNFHLLPRILILNSVLDSLKLFSFFLLLLLGRLHLRLLSCDMRGFLGLLAHIKVQWNLRMPLIITDESSNGNKCNFGQACESQHGRSQPEWWKNY